MSDIDREQLGEWLSAYLDGELSEEQTTVVERLLREDASARQSLDALRRASELVPSLPRHAAPGWRPRSSGRYRMDSPSANCDSRFPNAMPTKRSW